MELPSKILKYIDNLYNRYIKKQLLILKIILILFFLLISLYAYNQINANISLIELKNLTEIRFWYFSTVAQFNGAIIGLILAALGISLVIHSEKTIFLFTRNEFILLKITIFILLSNTFLAFLLLSMFLNLDSLIKLISFSIIVETWALAFLGIFFVRIISSFENKVQHEVNLLNTEKIIEQLIIDHEVSNEGLNIVNIISQNQSVSINEIKVFAKTGACYLTYHFPDKQKFGNKIRLSPIPKKLFGALQIDNNLNSVLR